MPSPMPSLPSSNSFASSSSPSSSLPPSSFLPLPLRCLHSVVSFGFLSPALSSSKIRGVRRFVRSSVALIGCVTAWLAMWYIIETELWITSVNRNLLFVFIAYILMYATHSIGGQSGLPQIFYEPLMSSQWPFQWVDDICHLLADKRIEHLKDIEEQRRKTEEPWKTNLRIILGKYVSSFVAFLSGVLYWVGMYVLLDQYFYSSSTYIKHFPFIAIGFIGMILCGSLQIESGIWGEDLIATRPLDLFIYHIKCILSLFFQVLYWIGLDHTCEYYLFPPSLARNLCYIFFGFLIISLAQTAGGISGADDDDDDDDGDADEKAVEEIHRKSILSATNSPQSKITIPMDIPEENEGDVGMGGDVIVIPNSPIQHSQTTRERQSETEKTASTNPSPSPPSKGKVKRSAFQKFLDSKYCRWIRLVTSLLGGILFWEGVESQCITHTTFDYATRPGALYQEDDGSARYQGTLLPLLLMYFCGMFALLLTGTFFANAGVLPPVQITRGRPNGTQKLFSHSFAAQKQTTAFRQSKIWESAVRHIRRSIEGEAPPPQSVAPRKIEKPKGWRKLFGIKKKEKTKGKGEDSADNKKENTKAVELSPSKSQVTNAPSADPENVMTPPLEASPIQMQITLSNTQEENGDVSESSAHGNSNHLAVFQNAAQPPMASPARLPLPSDADGSLPREFHLK